MGFKRRWQQAHVTFAAQVLVTPAVASLWLTMQAFFVMSGSAAT